jgi:hypothetical protein
MNCRTKKSYIKPQLAIYGSIDSVTTQGAGTCTPSHCPDDPDNPGEEEGL